MHYRYKLTNKAIAMLLSVFMLFSIAAQAAEIPAPPMVQVYEESGEPCDSCDCDAPYYGYGDYGDYGDYGAGEGDGEYDDNENGDDENGYDENGDGIHDDDECDDDEPCDDELDDNENDYDEANDEDEYYDDMYEGDDSDIDDPCCDEAPDCDCEPYLDYEPEVYGCECEDCECEDCDCEECDCGGAANEYFLLTFSHEGDGAFIVGGIESDGSEEYNEPLEVAAGTIIHLQAIPELDTDPEWWSDTALVPVGNPQPFGDPNQRMLIMPAADATVSVSFLSGTTRQLTFIAVIGDAADPVFPPFANFDLNNDNENGSNFWDYNLWDLMMDTPVIEDIPAGTTVGFGAHDVGLVVDWSASNSNPEDEDRPFLFEPLSGISHGHRLVMPDFDVTVTVTFELDEFNILSDVAEGSGSITPSGRFPSGNLLNFILTPEQTSPATPNTGFRVRQLSEAVRTGGTDTNPTFGTPEYVLPAEPVRDPDTGAVTWPSPSRPRNDMRFLAYFEPVTINLESDRLEINDRIGTGSSASVNATSYPSSAARGAITFSTSLTGTFTEELYFGGETINPIALRATASEGTITVTAIPANIASGEFEQDLTIFVRRERVTTPLVVAVDFPPITFGLNPNSIPINVRDADSFDAVATGNATGEITFTDESRSALPTGLDVSSSGETVTVTQTAELTFLSNRTYTVIAQRGGAETTLNIVVNIPHPEITFNPGDGTVYPEYDTVDEYGFLDDLPVPVWEDYLFTGWVKIVNSIPVLVNIDTQFLDNTTLFATWGIPAININPSPNTLQDFGEDYFGYSVGTGTDEISPITVTVTNASSDVPTGPITVELRDDVRNSFSLSDNSLVSIPPPVEDGIPPGTRTFTVYPQEGLSVGEHTATVAVSIAGSTLVFNVRFVVLPAQPNVNWPTGLTAVFGDNLSEITFQPHLGGQQMNPPVPNVTTTEGVFEWVSPNTSVGNVGTRDFELRFTPDASYDGNFATVVESVPVIVNPKPINGPGVIGVVTPNADVLPVTTPPDVRPIHDGRYSASAVLWTQHSGPNAGWNQSMPFESGSEYQATIILTLPDNSNYTFTGFIGTATINGYAVNIPPVITNNGKTLEITYRFPETNRHAIAFEPTSLGFGDVYFGVLPLEEEVTINNLGNVVTGTGDLTVTLSSNFNSLFTIEDLDGIIAIPFGGSITFYVQPIIDNLTVGNHTATITIAPAPGNDSPMLPQTFEITINVIPVAPTISPTELSAVFGTILSGVDIGSVTASFERATATGTETVDVVGTFAWQSPTDTVGNRGIQTHVLIFTPTGPNAGNFTTVYQNMSIDVTPAPIETVNVTVPVPVAGIVPATTATPNHPGIVVNPAVTWYPDHSPFAITTEYEATVTIVADDNHFFPYDASATINNQAPTSSNRVSGSTLILTHMFPETGAHNVLISPDVTFSAVFGYNPETLGQTVTVQNLLDFEIGPLSVVLAGDSPTSFTIDGGNTIDSIAPGGTVQIVIRPYAGLNVATSPYEATLTVTSSDNRVLPQTIPINFTVTPANIAVADFTPIDSRPFTGSAHTPEVSLSFNGIDLVAGTDFTVGTWANNTSVGTATATITGQGNFTGTRVVTFEITRALISLVAVNVASPVVAEYADDAAVTAPEAPYSATLTWSPAPPVYYNVFLPETPYTAIITLTRTSDYHTFDGLAAATINGEAATFDVATPIEGDPTTVVIRFEFAPTGPAPIYSFTVFQEPHRIYTHGDLLDLTDLIVRIQYTLPALPVVYVNFEDFEDFSANGITTSLDNEIEIVYLTHNNTAVSITHTASDGTTIYTTTEPLVVTRRNLAYEGIIVSVDSIAYTGSPREPGFTVTFRGSSLATPADFVVRANSWQNNTNAGTASFIIDGDGNFTGDRTVNFTIDRAQIGSIAISGTTAPETGNTPEMDTSVLSLSPSGIFEVSSFVWNPAHDPFRGNTIYTATMTLTLPENSNHTFYGLTTATIDGYDATITNVSISENSESATISAAFTETEPAEIYGITIFAQPTTLIYDHGQQLDLTGLVVRITYEDSYYEDVPFARFVEEGITVITAYPAHEDYLFRNLHNGQPITITHVESGETAYTNNLTINTALAPNITFPSASPITFGDMLSTSNLTGGDSGTAVGTFAWANPNSEPNAGINQQFNVIFSPDSDSLQNYNWSGVPGWVPAQNHVSRLVVVTVNQATAPYITFPSASPITFGDTLYPSSNLTGGDSGTAVGTFAWAQPNYRPDAGINQQFSVIFTPDSDSLQNYNWSTSVYWSLEHGRVQQPVSVDVAQAVVREITTPLQSITRTAYEARETVSIESLRVFAGLPNSVEIITINEYITDLQINWSATPIFDPKGATYTFTGTLESTSNIDASGFVATTRTVTITTVVAEVPVFEREFILQEPNTVSSAADLGALLPTSGNIQIGSVIIAYTIAWDGTQEIDRSDVGEYETFTGTIAFPNAPAWLTLPDPPTVYRVIEVTDRTPAEITITDPTKVFDGQPAIAIASAPGVASSDFEIRWYNSYGIQLNEAPINAGEYTIRAAVEEGTASAEEFFGSATLDFNITQRGVLITASSHTIFQGDELPTPTWSSYNFVGEDIDNPPFINFNEAEARLNVSDSNTVGDSIIDIYPVPALDGQNGQNYNILPIINGTLRILPRPEITHITFTDIIRDRFVDIQAEGDTGQVVFNIFGNNLRSETVPGSGVWTNLIDSDSFLIGHSGFLFAHDHTLTVIDDRNATLIFDLTVFENTDTTSGVSGEVFVENTISPDAYSMPLSVMQLAAYSGEDESGSGNPNPPYIPTPTPEPTPSPEPIQPPSPTRSGGSRVTADDDAESEDENDDTYIMAPESELGNGANPGNNSDSGQNTGADPYDESTPADIQEAQRSGFGAWISSNLWWLSILLGLLIISASWWFIIGRKRRSLAAVAEVVEDVIDITDT